MSPLIKPVGLIGGTLLLLLIGRKAEAATLPPVEPPLPPPTPPPAPKPPAPPTPKGKIPLGAAGDFAPGALMGVVTTNGVNLRTSASEGSASLGTMDRGTLLELFSDGHRPPTAAASQGWEAARAANGVQGFIGAQFLSGRGVPKGPVEVPIEPGAPIDLPPDLNAQGGGGAPFNPGGVDLTPFITGENAPKDGGVFEPFNLAPLFAGAPPRGFGLQAPNFRQNGWFSPMVGARAPAYGQAQFAQNRQAEQAAGRLRAWLAQHSPSGRGMRG